MALGVLAEVYRAARLLWPLERSPTECAERNVADAKASAHSSVKTVHIGKLVGRRLHRVTHASARWALIQATRTKI